MNQIAVDQRLVTPSLFLVAACAISATPALNLFGEASPKGLLFTAGLSSVSLVGTEVAVKMHSDSQANLAQKCGAVAFAVILSPQMNKVLFPSVPLDYRCSMMFGTLEAGITGMVTIVTTKPTEPPKPSKKKMDPQQVLRELDILKGVAQKDLKLTSAAMLPNINQILGEFFDPDAVDAQKFRDLYYIDGIPTIRGKVKDPEAFVEGGGVVLIDKTALIERYFNIHLAEPETEGARNSPQGAATREAKKLLNHVFGYYLKKKAEIEHGAGGYHAKEKLRNNLENIFSVLVDAMNDCVDQVICQVEPVALKLILESDSSDAQITAAAYLAIYRSFLVDEVTGETNDPEGADLKRDLIKDVHQELKIPMPSFVEVGAAFQKRYNPGNYDQARREFFRRYDPLQYLIRAYDFVSNPKLFISLCQWYDENVFDDDMDETLKQNLMEKLGTFHEDYVDRTDLAVLYFLQKNQIITQG